MEELRRRQLLGRLALASAGTAALAGCAVRSGDDGSDPLVVTNNPEDMLDGSLEDARGQRVDVSPLVHNPGSAGEVEVTVTALDEEREELASTSEVFDFDNGEQREVTLEFSIPIETSFIEAEAARP